MSDKASKDLQLGSDMRLIFSGDGRADIVWNEHDLAGALGKTIADALAQLMQRALVAPGIPASPAASAGPGRLL